MKRLDRWRERRGDDLARVRLFARAREQLRAASRRALALPNKEQPK